MSYPNTTHRRQSSSSPSVRFSDTTNTRVIPGLWQLSDDETSTMYYTKADLLGIRSSLQTSAKLLRRATKRGTTLEDLTSQTDTSRGIEHLASKAMLLRVHTEKAHSVRIALVAQQDEGASPEHIAHVTSMATRDAAIRAVERAIQDEAAAYGPCDIVEQEEPSASLAFVLPSHHHPV